jgi:hypothetical protein
VRAGRECAANRQGHLVGPVVAAEQQDVDHLARRLRASVTGGQRGPQLVERGRPGAALALLGERQRVLEPARPALEQLEVVIEPRRGPEAPVQPFVTRDRPAGVADRDLARADPSADLQAGQRDRDRVAVLADRDQRLRIHARRRGLGCVERLAR